MQLHARRRQDPDTGSTREPTQVVSDRSLVVRNYDGTEAHEVRVTFLDPDGDRAFARTVAVASLETIAIQTRLERAVYRVRVRLDDEETDSAECLVGSGPDETALVETGNGTVSVAEGLF
ncbi:MAG: hypothetical protein BRD23_06445 [Halobacteriales archaeon SW_9_67_25]|jgi:hypothetical protein|nr:MAG: hypothetical protein BRD23_06445 [Halobacteriales archaeon SW_9_67_25]